MNEGNNRFFSYFGMFVAVLTIISSVSSVDVNASDRKFQSNYILELTDATFNQEVESPGVGLVLVEFWGPWCGVCRQMAPVLDSVNQQIGDRVKIGRVNIGENPQLMFRFEIEHLPTLMVFKNGQQMETRIGYQSREQLLKWIANYM